MRKQVYIQVPEPCHEDWNKMTPVQQGRYCESCCKTVFDFSTMSDQELIRYLSKPRGSTCGNFAEDQLNRVITEPAAAAKKRVWAAMLSFLIPLFIANRTQAQRRTVKAIPVEQPATVSVMNVLQGKVSGPMVVVPGSLTQPLIIEGTVIDTSGNPVAGASVEIKGLHLGVAADSSGKYRLSVPGAEKVTVIVSSVGYATSVIEIMKNTYAGKAEIVLQQEQKSLEDVIINAVTGSGLRGRIGGAMVVTRHTISYRKKVRDTLMNIISPEIKIFPNPAPRGGYVQVQVKTPANYRLTLMDNQSKVVLQTSFITTVQKQDHQLQLPSTIAAGVYYVIVTDEKTRKPFTQKLLIQ